jgi:omega-amidase
MNIVCCQTDIIWEDAAANHAHVDALLSANTPPPGSLIALPEMFATGFSMNVDCVAESHDGPTHRFLASTARKYQSYVVGGVVTKGEDGRAKNESVLFSPEGVELGRYHKIRPFAFGEKQTYAAGEKTVEWKIDDWRIAPFICYDLRFPEIFRTSAMRGTDLYVVIANWPVARIHHWVTLLQARAIENQAYVVGINRVGDDPKFHHTGRSLVVGPGGDILLDCGEREGIHSTDIDLTALQEYREKLPFLGDLHTEYVKAD